MSERLTPELEENIRRLAEDGAGFSDETVTVLLDELDAVRRERDDAVAQRDAARAERDALLPDYDPPVLHFEHGPGPVVLGGRLARHESIAQFSIQAQEALTLTAPTMPVDFGICLEPVGPAERRCVGSDASERNKRERARLEGRRKR